MYDSDDEMVITWIERACVGVYLLAAVGGLKGLSNVDKCVWISIKFSAIVCVYVYIVVVPGYLKLLVLIIFMKFVFNIFPFKF